MKNKALVISLALTLFFLIGAVSAVEDTNVSVSDVNNDVDIVSSVEESEEPVSSDNQGDELISSDAQEDEVISSDVQKDEVVSADTTKDKVVSSQNKVVKTVSNDNSDDDVSKPVKTKITKAAATVIKGRYYKVSLVDAKGNGLSDKTLKITFNGVTHKVKTDDKGVAKLKINAAKGKYKIKFSFSGDKNYLASSSYRNMLVINTKTPKIVASKYVAYVGLKNSFKVTLTIGGLALYNRKVILTLDGKNHTRRTNVNGVASMSIKNLKKVGTYKIKYTFLGENNIKKVSGTSKVVIKKGIKTKISKANSEVYIHKMASPFKVKLTDARGKAVAKKKVVFTVNHKKYVKTTNKHGIATLNLKLAKGNYKVKVLSNKNATHKKATKTFKIKVNPRGPIHNGVWLFAGDMKKVSLKKLAKYHIKEIFVNQVCLDWYGKSYVQSFIKKAGHYGMKVHIWMQVFYWGNWKYPVYKNGHYNYKLINSKVKQAVKFAKVKGVAGVHFDYVRFPGNAYQYKNGADAVSYFVKKASKAIHKVNPNLIVSAALMPEPDSMKYYYGQDVPTMSKYLDALVPMIYKGNYGAGTSWIQKMTKIFVKKSKKAQVWTGLQSYGSDSNVKRLSASELKKDATSAAKGGATGIILFRSGLANYFDFNKLVV